MAEQHSHTTAEQDERNPMSFCSTRWSVVMAAGNLKNEDAGEALEALCQTYWYPIYVFIRRRGHSHHEAQDLTQDFLSDFVISSGLTNANREQGRFRCYLIGALKHYLANDWDKQNRIKRGGGKRILSWESLMPEERYGFESQNGVTPERSLDREWARRVVDLALAKLREDAVRDGSEARFEVLRKFLPGHSTDSSYEDAAQLLGVTESAVKSAIHRLRRRFADHFRLEVLQTVSDPEDLEDEIRHLFGALVGQS